VRWQAGTRQACLLCNSCVLSWRPAIFCLPFTTCFPCGMQQGWLKADVSTAVQARSAGEVAGRNQAGLRVAWLLRAAMSEVCLECPSVYGAFCEVHQGWLKADVPTTVQARRAGEMAGRNQQLACCVVAVCCNEVAVFMPFSARSVLREASGVVESRRSHHCSSQKGRCAGRQEVPLVMQACFFRACWVLSSGTNLVAPFRAWLSCDIAPGVVGSRRSRCSSQKGR
jgi:hypothetical protein